jgi:hypothetical protein
MSWSETNEQLRRLEKRQIFFIGGAPRSGTTWLQQIIDRHPQASCRGEGLFSKDLFRLLEDCMEKRSSLLDEKNRRVFGHTKGYPLPAQGDSDFLAATAMLLALHQQAEGRDCLAYGEKTPENVFAFPRFKRLFPQAKFIGIARDPRDVLTSAWHFFGKSSGTADDDAAKLAFITAALPALNDGARQMMALRKTYPGSCHMVTYEGLRTEPAARVAEIFEFLCLPASAAVVRDCVEQTAFDRMTGGRPAGEGAERSFLRKGTVGDWRSTLSPAMNDLILRQLGWMFPHFGWTQ